MEWKKLKSQYILWPYKELTDEFCPFQRHSVRLHKGRLVFLLGVGTSIIIIFIINSMSTRGAAALHQYSCFMCWYPAIKFKATAPLFKSHTDVVVEVTLAEDALWRYQLSRQKGGWDLGDKSCKMQHEEDLQKRLQSS